MHGVNDLTNVDAALYRNIGNFLCSKPTRLRNSENNLVNVRTMHATTLRLIGVVVILLAMIANAQETESRWERYIQYFEQLDVTKMPPENAVLFVGSSSIVFWRSLADDMAPLAVINRGFGGSQMHELNQFRDRIVTKYKPRAIVIYEGDNDVFFGKSVEQILGSYDDFISHVDKESPDADICFIAVKPSISREELWPTMEEVNHELRKRADDREDMCYLDIATPMMEAEGFVREDLFVEDGLHLNTKGYAVWTETIRPILVKRYGPKSERPAALQPANERTEETEANE